MDDIFKFSPQPSADTLCAFVDSLGDEHGPPVGEESRKESEAAASSETKTDIWDVMSNAFDSWLTRIVDVESRLSTDHSFKKHRIDQAIQRMLEDGLIGVCDANELRFIGDSWMRLIDSYSYYSIGCRAYRQDIFSALLDLFSARQIAKTIFLKVCEQL